MPRIDHCHWLVAAGESWSSIAAACGMDKRDVARANEVNAPPSGPISPQPSSGVVVHLPFLEA